MPLGCTQVHLNDITSKPTCMHTDNQAALALVYNTILDVNVQNTCAKHIDIQYHFTRERVSAQYRPTGSGAACSLHSSSLSFLLALFSDIPHAISVQVSNNSYVEDHKP